MELNEKQILFFKGLKQIKDTNVEIYSSYLHPNSRLNSTVLKSEYKHLQEKLSTDKDIEFFKKIQNEIVESAIYEIMELIDGYGRLDFKIDIIDRETKKSLRENIELHDSFMTYLMENEDDFNE